PFLLNGFDHIVLHLSHHAEETVRFTLEIDPDGDNSWEEYKHITVPAEGYDFFVFPEGFSTSWIRLKTDRDCQATAFFHLQSEGHDPSKEEDMFAGLADIGEPGAITAGLIRPGAHNRNLQFLMLSGTGEATDQDAGRHHAAQGNYFEVDERLDFVRPAEDRSAEVSEICRLRQEFKVDEASVIVTDKTGTYRLPKTDPR